MKPLKEADIFDAYKRAVGRLVTDYGEITDMVKDNLKEIIKTHQTADLESVQTALLETRKLILDLFKKKKTGEITLGAYDAEYVRLSARVIELEEMEKAIKSEDLKNQLNRQRLEETFNILSEEDVDITEESTMRGLLECIIVKCKHALEFQFKCGVDITETV